MTEVFIKHNPYKIKSTFKIDNDLIPDNSKLASFINERLQYWIYDLVEEIEKEVNSKNFNISFKGRQVDFEDIKEVVAEYNNKDYKIGLKHIKVDDTKDKLEKLKKLFDFMLEGPFEKLKTNKVKKEFNKALNQEFGISIIATMSSGKSTLLNAMLGENILPTKNEACTANVVMIKDKNEQKHFSGKAFDFDKNQIYQYSEINSEIMFNLNSTADVGFVELEGNIPFVSSDLMNLVLVDTPGPNNSRDIKHKEYTYNVIKEERKPMVLYIMNGGQLNTNDDNTLLEEVAEQMKLADKQSKDRFIFVINKVDKFDPEAGECIQDIINKQKEYLESKGIENPNIYPLSAQMAKLLRLKLNDKELTRHEKIELGMKDLFNDEKEMQLLNYMPLSKRLKSNIQEKIEIAKEGGNDEVQALHHSGITSIEAVINEYINKYALASKIKHAVDSFQDIIKEERFFDQIKEEIYNDQQKREDLNKKMKIINEEIKKGEKAKNFKNKIKDIEFKPEDNLNPLRNKIEKVILDLQEKFSSQKITESEARILTKDARKKLEDLQVRIISDLNNYVPQQIKNKVEELLAEYKDYIEGIIEIDDDFNIQNNISNLISSSTPNTDRLLNEYKYQKREKVGTKKVKNSKRKWYLPWTLFTEPKHLTKAVYQQKQYVKGKKLFQDMVQPVRKRINQNINNAYQYVEEEEVKLKDYFYGEIDNLNKLLNDKLTKLEKISESNFDLEEEISRNQKKKEWLINLEKRLDSIIEI